MIFVSIIPECKKVIMVDPWFSSSFSDATISTLDLALSDSGFDAIEEPISMHFDLIEIGCPNLCLPKNFLVANVNQKNRGTFMKKNNIGIFGIFNIVNAFYSVWTHFSFGVGSRDIFIIGEYVTSISILKKWSLPRFRFYFVVFRILKTKNFG